MVMSSGIPLVVVVAYIVDTIIVARKNAIAFILYLKSEAAVFVIIEKKEVILYYPAFTIVLHWRYPARAM